MNLFPKITNLFKTRKTDDQIISEALIVSDVKSKNNTTKDLFKRIKHQGLEYGGSLSKRGYDFKPPEYDLNQIAAIIDIDSYLRRAIEKYVELILKNGFDFVGKNSYTVKYIRKRFEQIALVTNIPTVQLFEDICQQLVAYSNCFISKVRSEKASGGNVRTTFYGKELKPVAGYFVEDATSMYIAKDIYGQILGYKQIIQGSSDSPEWNSEDMIHIYYSRKRGLSFGTPLSYPVIDDIKALRKIEQNIEILSHQHTIPIIHYKIGEKDSPGTPEEVSAVKLELENGAPYGCIVTTNRHEIKGIDVNINAEGADKLAELFKMRVYAGLGVSPLIMGDGAGTGRQTAESLDKQMENTAEKYMQVLETFINDFMIKELLEENGYKYDAYDDKDKVTLQFPPINLEAKHKSEEHLNNMYQGNILTESEVRISMGRDPMTEQQRIDTNLYHTQIPLAIIKAVDETYTGSGHGTPSKSGSSIQAVVKQAVSSVNQTKKIQNKIANIAQPSNQHGKSLARPRITKDNLLLDKIENHYKATIEDLIMSIEDGSFDKSVKRIITTTKNMIKNNIDEYFKYNYIEGYKTIKGADFINFNTNIRDSISQKELNINSNFDKIIEKLMKFTNSDNKIYKISIIHSLINNYKDTFKEILITDLNKFYNMGIIQAISDSDIESINLNADNCNCNHRSKELTLNAIDLAEIPPINSDCNCYITIKE